MEDITNFGNDLEMHPSMRNEGPTAIVVDKLSKSFLCFDGEEPEEQSGRSLGYK